jgi:hypothetical protein
MPLKSTEEWDRSEKLSLNPHRLGFRLQPSKEWIGGRAGFRATTAQSCNQLLACGGLGQALQLRQASLPILALPLGIRERHDGASVT